jgi:hypothetical protein
MVREHAEKMKAPRVLFVPFPFGYTLGKPNDPQLQHRVIGAVIDLLQRERGPVLEDFPEEEVPEALVQASGVQRMAAETEQDPADEVTTLRIFYERWLEDYNYEARMAQRPNVSESELHRWFWGETAVAQLIRAVAQRMTSTDDPALKYFAYGLVR